MHINYHFLKKLVPELEKELKGLALSLCFSQDKDEMIMGFCDETKEVYLRILVSPSFSFINKIAAYSRAKRNTVNLWTPIYGSKLENIGVFENERAIFLTFNENIKIVIKFFGNRPNILLYQNNVQVGMFNNNLESDKKLLIEDFNKKLDFSFENFQKNSSDFKKTFVTFGKILNEYIENYFSTKDFGLREKYDFLIKKHAEIEQQNINVGFHKGIPTLSLMPINETEMVFQNGIEALYTFYNLHQNNFGFSKEKEIQKKRIEKEIQKTQTYKIEIEKKLYNLEISTKNEEIANILMANLHLLKEGCQEVELHNFYTNKPIKIKLKKDLSPQKNAENYYRKSKNEKIEIETLTKNIEYARQKIELLQNELNAINQTQTNKELKSTLKENKPQNLNNNKPDKTELFKCFNYQDYEIMVGKNAKNNDILTMKYANKEDIWLHARDSPGSHVIIKTDNKGTVPTQVLEYAAGLAAAYSKRKNEKLVPVIYTFKKYVRKQKGFKDGEVKLDRETVLMIEPLEI